MSDGYCGAGREQCTGQRYEVSHEEIGRLSEWTL